MAAGMAAEWGENVPTEVPNEAPNEAPNDPDPQRNGIRQSGGYGVPPDAETIAGDLLRRRPQTLPEAGFFLRLHSVFL